MASLQIGILSGRLRLGSNEKVEMTLSASEWVGRRLLGLICVFFPSSVGRDMVLSPLWANLRTSIGQIPELGSGGSSP